MVNTFVCQAPKTGIVLYYFSQSDISIPGVGQFVLGQFVPGQFVLGQFVPNLGQFVPKFEKLKFFVYVYVNFIKTLSTSSVCTK